MEENREQTTDPILKESIKLDIEPENIDEESSETE